MKKLQMFGICVLVGAIVLLAVDVILVVFFGGIKVEFQDFMLRSVTIEFPLVGLLIAIFCLLLVKGQGRESLLLLFSLVFAGILGEGILRIVDHPLSKPFVDVMTWQEPSDSLGFTMAPNFEGIGPVSSWVKTNSQGVRDDVEHSWVKDPGTIRILGIGDSFTFGWGVSLEETFLKKLEHTLKQMTGVEIETINAGVPQWDLNHYYVYLKNIGIRYSPDIIVLTYFFNDIPRSIQETIPADPEYQIGVRKKGGIFGFSYVFNFLKAQADHLRRKNKLARVDFLSTLEARRPELIQQSTRLLLSNAKQAQTRVSFDILKTLLKKIQAIAQKNNSHLVVMFVPDVAQTHQPELQYINQVLASLTYEMHIPFADITPVFESVSDPRIFYFWPRDWHTNAHGHTKMAEALTPLLCQVLQQRNIHCK
ncbi:MAG: SGNH/GDSL hydrolase family protein [Nitrospirae bacterium]|nr:SGNH/GDSL hydrolase family protein [Nitrospirota bacterium]